MKPPRKAKHWHKEISLALQQATVLAKTEHGSMNATAKQNLYKYAPLFAMKNRGLNDKTVRESVLRYCAQLRAYDFATEPETIDNYAINFILSYLDAHVCMQTISERKAEELMEAMVESPEGLPGFNEFLH